MDTEDQQDVTENSSDSSNPEDDNVEASESEGNDKDKNFAKLRELASAKDLKIAELEAALELKEGARSLNTSDDSEVQEEKPKKATGDNTLKLIFDRDMKEATRSWNKTNKVPAEVWNKIKSKIILTGEETTSEIYDKIDEIHSNIPEVRAEKDKELVNKGKKEAMRQFQDSELDYGGGGDVDMDSDAAPRLDSKTKTWAKALGMSDKDMKEVNQDSNPEQWTEGKEAKRAFFQP